MEFSPGVGDSIGTYSLALEVASPGGCHDSLLWPVLVFPVPEAEFGWEPYDPVDIAPEVTLKNLSQPESCQSLNELWIYNSWGDLVFHATNIREHEQFWDPNERACPDGTYYYRFLGRSSHGVVRRNGVIEVVR